MSSYITEELSKGTPQTESVPGTVKNSAGGYSFPVDKWTRLERFLILGSEGGTYYINQGKLTRENAQAARECIKEDGLKVLDMVCNISLKGRSHKTDPLLFVHALASVEGDEEVRQVAFSVLQKIARTGTHLFHWVDFRNTLGGWGSGTRKAISSWYLDQEVNRLGYQMIKYKQRDGWSHLDVLRLAHVKPDNPQVNALFSYVKAQAKGTDIPPEHFDLLPEQVQAAWTLKHKKKVDVINDIITYNLPREVVPTEFLNDPQIWDALLVNMPFTAMIRNLGNMSKVGLLKANSEAAKMVVELLNDWESLKKARVHPLQIIAALFTYSSGTGFLGKGSWTPVSTVVDALDDAFYKSFELIEPSGKRFMLGIDVSASMTQRLNGLISLSCAAGAAVMAMVTARTEPQYEILGFSHRLKNLGITAKDSLKSAQGKVQDNNFGGTDCSLLFKYAAKDKIDVDTFVTYTDSETSAGRSHPFEELNKYRNKMSIPAKSIVVGMNSNGFTIADPNDAGMLDLVGFDSGSPKVIADFAKS